MLLRVLRGVVGLLFVLAGVGPTDVRENLADWFRLIRVGDVDAPGISLPDIDWIVVLIGLLIVLTSIFEPRQILARLRPTSARFRWSIWPQLYWRLGIPRLYVPMMGKRPVI